MLKNFIFFILIIPLLKIYSQNAVSGNVYNENQFPLSGVLVVNIDNDLKTITDENGHFVINANAGNELRFIRENYERISLKVKYENINSSLRIELKYLPKDIETVLLNYKPTGNLKEDIKHYGESKKDLKLNEDLGKYNRTYSSREIMKPKRGEFIQPKGPGFEVIKIGYQWKPLDVAVNLQSIIGNDYFIKMGINKSLIFSFINFILKDFDTEKIRRFGRLTSADISKFQAEAERQIVNFKAK